MAYGDNVDPKNRVVAIVLVGLLTAVLGYIDLLDQQLSVQMSGLPGGGPDEKTPNWITSSWPLEAMEMLEWQWSERVIPFWTEIAAVAAKGGVRLCVENHGRQCVYNPDSYFRLREAAGLKPFTWLPRPIVNRPLLRCWMSQASIARASNSASVGALAVAHCTDTFALLPLTNRNLPR